MQRMAAALLLEDYQRGTTATKAQNLARLGTRQKEEWSSLCGHNNTVLLAH